jgi:hypothetical protein
MHSLLSIDIASIEIEAYSVDDPLTGSKYILKKQFYSRLYAIHL